MKKVLGLVLVIFFMFSFLPANAGPTYEKMKMQNKAFFSFYENPNTDRDINALVRFMMNKKGLTKETFLSAGGEVLKITKFEHIFSDESFRKTIVGNEKIFAKKLFKFFRVIKEEEFDHFLDLSRKDLTGKGLSGDEADHVQLLIAILKLEFNLAEIRGSLEELKQKLKKTKKL